MQSIRVYAFTDDAGKLALARNGNVLDGFNVQLISNGMLHAITTSEPIGFPWQLEKHDPAGTFMRYQRICSAAAALDKVVPASMECQFLHTSSIWEALGQHQREILDILSRYGSARQFSLRVEWDPQQLGPMIAQAGGDFEKERRAMRNQILQQLQSCLSDIIILESNEKCLVLQALLLIPRHAEERLARILGSIDRDNQGQLVMRLIGPTPACHFACVDIRLPAARILRKDRRVLGVHGEIRLSDIKNAYRQKIKGLHPDHAPNARQSDKMVRLTQSYRYLSRLAAQQNNLLGNDPDKQWLRCDSRTLRHTPLLSIQRGLAPQDDVLLIRH